MSHFNDKIAVVLSQDKERIQAETALVETMPMEERMARIDEFLLDVGESTATFLNMLMKETRAKTILEIGTSYGYSTIWLAEASSATGGKVITLEISPAKAAYAQTKIEEAGLTAFVDFRVGDALQLIVEANETFDFVLVDLWKELYVPCLNLFVLKLKKDAWVIADNMIFPPHDQQIVMAYRNRVKAMEAFETLLLPIGSGIEVSQFKNLKANVKSL
jgi:predicted O-methyltransferase YrrM